MDNAYQVVVAPRAADMLDEHAGFLAIVNENAADRLVAEFVEIADSLRHMPERNPWFDPTERKHRKVLLAKRYLILYQINERSKTVYIDYTIDCRRDNSWLMF